MMTLPEAIAISCTIIAGIVGVHLNVDGAAWVTAIGLFFLILKL